MERYVVKITDDALANMEELYGYISQKLLAPETALRLYSKIIH